MKFFCVLATVAAASAKPARDSFAPELIYRNTSTAVNLTLTDACKHTGIYTVSFWLSNNAADMGFLYPMKLGKFKVFAALADNDKKPKSFDEIANIETDAKKIFESKYIGLKYVGSVMAHEDLHVPFKFTTLNQKGFINFTISSRCEHETKDDVLLPFKGIFPAPKLVASSQQAPASLILFLASLTFVMA